MTYDETQLMKAFDYQDTAGLSDQQIEEAWPSGPLFLGYLDPGPDGSIGSPSADADDLWRPATSGNFGQGTTVINNYLGPHPKQDVTQGSWSNFVTQYDVTEENLGTFLGSWGIDTNNNVMWSIVNHNSQFAPIPEPSTLFLLIPAASIMALRRQRRVKV